ncbi:MAG: hypothetical protein EYC68_06460 [Chloroflexota bacterium]|nr:MAG: hypothetical protein EYC68_06460 [Chloroflexota bacterium]
MEDVAAALKDLNSDSAKTRERVIKNLTPALLQDAQVIEALQKIVSTDPVEYVREAARVQLVAIGQTPRESVAPIQMKQEGAGKPAIFAVGLVGAVIAICVCVPIFVITILAMTGPQIGNIFSRITNGLAAP